MSDDRGLYKKFHVERTDASPRHPDCDYFVLDLTHDPHAATALRAYADVAEQDRPDLARDLRALANHGTDSEFDARVARQIQHCWMCGAVSGQQHAGACSVDGPMP